MKFPLRILSLSFLVALCVQSAISQNSNNSGKQPSTKVEARLLNKSPEDSASKPAPDTSTSESSWEVKEDLYERFVANRMSNADAAYEAGKEYLRIFEPVDGSSDQYVAYIKKWVGFYEKLAQEREKYKPDDPATRIYSPKEVTEKARIIFKPEPLYTEEARIKQIDGFVLLKAVFRADGQVTDIRAVSKLPSGLTESAIDAAHRITFTPAMKDGRLVSQFGKIRFNFNLY